MPSKMYYSKTFNSANREAHSANREAHSANREAHSANREAHNHTSPFEHSEGHPSVIEHPRHIEYVSSIRYIRSLCDGYAEVKTEDERLLAMNQLFSYLCTHPYVLEHSTKIRSAIKHKIKQAELYLDKSNEILKQANYLTAVGVFTTSVEKTVRHELIRNEIITHLNDITRHIGEYNEIISKHPVKRNLTTLKTIIYYIEKKNAYIHNM